jgi:hypothetical protein
MNEPMLAVLVCEKYGWTYEEYLRQPEWFISLISDKMEAESMFSGREKRQT